jgi:hypothetical protein
LRTSKSEKELEIIILRQQVRILQRKTKTVVATSLIHQVWNELRAVITVSPANS